VSVQWRDVGGSIRSAGAISMRDASNVVRTVDQVRIRDEGGVLREVYKQGIRLAVNPATAVGASSAKTGAIYTNSVVVGVAGGTPPYAHSWVPDGSLVATNPGGDTTAFYGTPTAVFGELNGQATDHVTDANGLTNSISVDISIQRG